MKHLFYFFAILSSFLGLNYKGIFDHKHLGSSHDCHYESSFEIRSSKTGKGDLAGVFIATQNKNQVESSSRLSWGKDLKDEISGAMTLKKKDSWKDVEFTAEYKAPTRRPKPVDISVEFNYTLHGSSLKGAGKAYYNDHSVDITLDGLYNAPNFTGNLMLQSTCHDRWKILTGLNYTQHKGRSSTDAIFALTTTNTNSDNFTVTMNRKQEFSPVYKNSGRIDLVTTDRNARKFNITWDRIQDGNDISTDATLMIPSSKHTLTYVSNIKGLVRTADVKVASKHLHAHRRNMMFHSTYAETPNSAKLTAKNTEGINRTTELIEATVHFDGAIIDADIKLNLLSHFRVLLSNNKENKDWVSSLKLYSLPRIPGFSEDFDLTDKYLSAAELQSRIRPDGTLLDSRLKSWSRHHRNRNIEIRAQKHPESFETSLKIQEDSSLVSLSGEFHFGENKRILLDVETPHRDWERLHVVIDQSGNINDFVVKADILHTSLSENIILELQSDVSDVKDIKFKVDWKSPFKLARKLNTVYSHKVDQDNVVTMSGSLEIPKFKASIYSHLKLHGWRSFDTKTELVYGQNQKYSLETGHEVSEKSNGFIKLETPFASAEHLSLKVSYEGRLRDCKGNIEIGLDKHRLISIAISRYHERDIHFVTRVTTPFEQYRTMGIDFNFVGYMDDYKQDWAFTLEDKRLAGQNDWFWKGTTVDYTSAMQTPFGGFESLKFNFKHEGPLDVFENQMTFQYSKGKSTVLCRFSLEEDKLSGRLDVSLAPLAKPFFNIPNNINLIVGHTGGLRDFQNSLRLNIDDDSFHASSHLKIEELNVKVIAQLTSPTQKISASAQHEGDWNDFKCNYMLNINDKSIALKNNFKIENEIIDGKMFIETSYASMKSMNVAFNYNHLLDNFLRVAMATNDRVYKVDHTIKSEEYQFRFGDLLTRESGHFSWKAALYLPEEYSINFRVTKVPTTNNITLTATLKANDQNLLTGNSNLTVNDRRFRGVTISLTTPFRRYREVKAAFKPTIQASGQTSKYEGTLDIESRTYSGIITLQDQPSKTIVADLKTPSLSLVARTEYRGNLNDFEARFDATVNNVKYAVSSEFKLQEQHLKLDAKTKIPEEYSIMLETKGDLSEFGSTFIIGMNGQHIHATTAFKKRANDIDLALSILTPFSSFERQVLKFTHSGHINKFKSSSQLQTSFVGYENSGFNVEFTGHASQFSVVADLYTPFNMVKTASVRVNHQAGRNSLSSDIALNRNRNSLSGTLTFEKTGDNIKSYVTVDSSFRKFEKFIVSLTKEGSINDFHSALTINTPFEMLSTFEVNVFHNGYIEQFSNGLVVNYNGNMIKGNIGFDMTRGVKLRASVELPMQGIEKFTLTFNQDKQGQTYKTNIDIETPFENYKSIGFKSKILPSKNNFQINLNINFIKAIEANFINKLGRNRMTTSASLLLPDLRINLVNTFSKTLMRVAASGSVETSLADMERLAYICAMDWSEEDMVHITAKVDHPFSQYASPALQISVKVMEDWYRDFETTAVITTITKTDPPINFNLMHKVDDNRISTSTYLVFKNKKTNAAFEYSSSNDFAEWRGLLETPLKGYETFAYSFRKSATGNTKVYSGKLETPFANINDPSFDIEVENSRKMFKVSSALTLPFKWITPITGSLTYETQPGQITIRGNVQANEKYVRLISEFKKIEDFVKNSITIDTSFVGYENFGTYFEGRYKDAMMTAKINAVLPKALKTTNPMLEITHHGRINDFTTELKLQVPVKNIRLVTLRIKHKAEWININTEIGVSYGTLSYLGLVKLHKSSSGLEFSTSYTMPTKDKFSLDLVHSGDEERFSTTLRVHAPYQEYADAEVELLHETLSNTMGTSIKVVTPFKHIDPVTVTIQNTGHMRDFTTNVRVRYNGQTISLNGAFEKIDRNIKASGELHTPFANYEHFGFAFSHNENGEKIRTTGNIVLPFREYVSPSFDVDYRGSPNNFTTKVTFRTPFQSIDPVVFTVNHRGVITDFQTTMNVQYQGQSVIASVSFKLAGENLLVSTMVETPSLAGKKYGLSFEHQNVGKAFLTKFSIEAPQLGRGKLAFELTTQILVDGFRFNGKIETPFRTGKEISFSFDHKGTPKDFNAKGYLVVDGQRVEEDIQYRQVQSDSRTSHEAFGRITTPWASMRKLEMSLSHAMSDKEWTGSVKGSYNRKAIDADYTFSWNSQKTLDISIQKPTPMKYTVTVDLEAKNLMAYLNWDKQSANKQMRMEATLKNLVSETSTEREVKLKVTHPTRKILVKSGYEVTNGKFLTSAKVEWGDSESQKILMEFVSTSTSRRNQDQTVSRLKVRSAVANAEVMVDHRVTAGRHYVTRLTVQTAETLTITSDITKTADGFKSSFTMEHPHISDFVSIITVPILLFNHHHFLCAF